MKFKFKYLFFLMLFAIAGCEILDEKPMTDLTPGSFYTTATGYEALINGCYSLLRTILNEREDYLYATDLGTDIWEYGIDGKPINDLYTSEFDGTDQYITRLWNNIYTAINHANYGVKFGDIVEELDDNRRMNLKAQACFIRAYYYFIVVRTWGGVHLSLEATEGVELEANKTPVPVFFDAIIADLEFAIKNLPATQNDWGRVTKYAAMQLLAYVLLTDERSSQHEYNRVVELTDEIKASGRFSLLPDREAVFEFNNQINQEVIWSVQFAEDYGLLGPGGRMNVFFVSKYDIVRGLVRSIEYQRPYARLAPTKFYLSLFDNNNDSRYEKFFRTIYYCNNEVPGLNIGDTALWYPNYTLTQAQRELAKYTYYEPSNVTKIFYPSLKKWDETSRTGPNDNMGKKDHIVYRFADTYLLAAEAHWRLSEDDKALDNINIVRRISAKPGKEEQMTISSASDSQIMDIILNERALELGGEQNRWFDLKRFGVLLEYVQARRPESEIKEYHLLRPIPSTQIDRTSNTYTQNPGYPR